jgi:hypothetical protein
MNLEIIVVFSGGCFLVAAYPLCPTALKYPKLNLRIGWAS